MDLSLPGNSRLIPLNTFSDHRGILSVIDFSTSLKFSPTRFFCINEVPQGTSRGNHAHKTCHQLLISLAGSVAIELDDGSAKSSLTLDNPHIALHIPPKVWSYQHSHSIDNLLGVFASEPYNPAEYIDHYDEFVELTTKS
jgi:UDP-2-acetamido-3-amino-2,3-dideoxy-glucuronate N-acetyltransferase